MIEMTTEIRGWIDRASENWNRERTSTLTQQTDCCTAKSAESRAKP